MFAAERVGDVSFCAQRRIADRAVCRCVLSIVCNSSLCCFAGNRENPVVAAGQLWSRICGGAGKHCEPGTHDEVRSVAQFYKKDTLLIVIMLQGTPEIIQKDAQGFYWVTLCAPSFGSY